MEQLQGSRRDARRKHIAIFGKSRVGKSTLLRHFGLLCLDYSNYDLGVEIADIGLSFRPSPDRFVSSLVAAGEGSLPAACRRAGSGFYAWSGIPRKPRISFSREGIVITQLPP